MRGGKQTGGIGIFTTAIGLATAVLAASQPAAADDTARGVVYEDRNGNQQRDADEPGIAGVAVTNQEQVVVTDADGAYALPVTDDTIIFVVKPTGYAVPVSDQQLPRFYYIHRPAGSPPFKFPGIAPTGPLPASIDFPLTREEEPENFSVVVFADPQPQTGQEVDYVRDDVVSPLVGTDAKFGITVGDIMFDNLSLFGYYNKIVGLIGIPFHNVIGNHDQNYDAATDADSDDTFNRFYGPNYCAWNYARVHFVALDTVEWHSNGKGGGHYRGALPARQLAWLKQDLALVPADRLIVLTMHIPLVAGDEVVEGLPELLELLKDRPRVLAVAGHTHYQEHVYLTPERGWQGHGVFHELISGTVSGSWWSGPKDARGVPIADCRGGAPNGYTMIDFAGDDYVTSYVPARGAADDAMRIYPPGSTGRDDAARRRLVVNVFDGSVKCRVEYAFDGGEFHAMVREVMKDPFVEAMLEGAMSSGKSWATAWPCTHIWATDLADGLARGTHVVTVRVVDQFGRTYSRSKVFDYR
ncbi:MAG TPA: calcineurin-like phosphoesterase C-terminal domain-containing protein [Phycisphaerae bacterium]|nr:calcineurin-like phosphoesterase C-terminal domain-containing protein [Phycisphaerae bacterium]